MTTGQPKQLTIPVTQDYTYITRHQVTVSRSGTFTFLLALIAEPFLNFAICHVPTERRHSTQRVSVVLRETCPVLMITETIDNV